MATAELAEPGTASASACAHCAALAEHATFCAREFHARVLPRTLPVLRQRLEARPSFLQTLHDLVSHLRPRLVGSLIAIAAAALLLLWRSPFLVPSSGDVDVGEVAIKGAADSLPQILLRRHGAVTVVGDGAILHPGDALAFSVPPGLARYALVVSIDGEQRISVYSPYDGEASAPIPLSVSSVSLEPAIVLDGALGPERLWLLLSDRPLAVALVRPALERLAAAGSAGVEAATARALLDDVPFRIEASTWLFDKRSP